MIETQMCVICQTRSLGQAEKRRETKKRELETEKRKLEPAMKEAEANLRKAKARRTESAALVG